MNNDKVKELMDEFDVQFITSHTEVESMTQEQFRGDEGFIKYIKQALVSNMAKELMQCGIGELETESEVEEDEYMTKFKHKYHLTAVDPDKFHKFIKAVYQLGYDEGVDETRNDMMYYIHRIEAEIKNIKNRHEI